MKKIQGNLFSRIFYVGITLNCKRRSNEHLSKKVNPIKKNIIHKYGYELIPLWENLLKEEAVEREVFLIKYFGRIDLNTGQLANLTDGGEGTETKSLECRQKIALSKCKTPINLRNKIIDEYKESGLSVTEFCKVKNLNRTQLYNWINHFANNLVSSRRKRYSKEEIKNHLENSKDKNLTDYCQLNNLKKTTLLDWRVTYKYSNSRRIKQNAQF